MTALAAPLRQNRAGRHWSQCPGCTAVLIVEPRDRWTCKHCATDFELHDQHSTRRDRHRPKDRQAIEREARRLHTTGLTPRDIASALSMPIPDVLEVVRESAGDGR